MKKSKKNHSPAVESAPKNDEAFFGGKTKVILDFEQPIAQLEKKIEELKTLAQGGMDLEVEIKTLKEKLEKAQKELKELLTVRQEAILKQQGLFD